MTRFSLPSGFFLLAFAALALPAPAGADEKQQTSDAQWRAMDGCAHEAFRKFPDYTHESNLKREAYRRSCLRKKGLPAPDDPLPQPH
ncbi:MAG TPA: hypothetical protein VN832_11580 [Stellaceae bacterium]|nr:hypothetical protein [Stellaceae bacterium]